MESLWEVLSGTDHSVQFIDVYGIRTRIVSAGSGEPLILLHGTGGHLEAFIRNIGPLSSYFRVIVLDLLGHGYTGPPTDDILDWASVAEHAIGTLDALDIRDAVWIGEALGAQAAQWAAVRFPNRVRRLILCCAGVLPEEDADDVETVAAARSFQELTSRALAAPTSEVVMRERMQWLHLGPELVNDELLSMRMRFWAQPGFVDRQRALLSGLRSARTSPRTGLTAADVGRISVPTLLLWTEHNPLMSLRDALRLKNRIGANAELNTFARSAMWPQYDEHERFNKTVIDWIAEGP